VCDILLALLLQFQLRPRSKTHSRTKGLRGEKKADCTSHAQSAHQILYFAQISALNTKQINFFLTAAVYMFCSNSSSNLTSEVSPRVRMLIFGCSRFHCSCTDSFMSNLPTAVVLKNSGGKGVNFLSACAEARSFRI
jgi:hypothetical protein